MNPALSVLTSLIHLCNFSDISLLFVAAMVISEGLVQSTYVPGRRQSPETLKSNTFNFCSFIDMI